MILERKYAVSDTVKFSLYKADGSEFLIGTSFDTGDVTIAIDGGSEVNTTNLPTTLGSGYTLTLTSGELTGKKISIFVRDQTATKVWLDREIYIETYDNTSAQKYLTKSDVIHYGYAQGAGVGGNQIVLSTSASSEDGAYDPSKVFIVSGTGAGQTRLIMQYNGSTRTATVDRDWKIEPDTTSEYRISAEIGREHVNEGLAQGGTETTITLNTLASANNGSYVNQIVFIRSGLGEDQVRRVSAYNGTTKVATVDSAWDVIPDTTSCYVMLPCIVKDVYAEIWQTVMTDVASGELAIGQDITAEKALRALFARFFRQVSMTSSAQTVKNDSGVTIASMTVSDDGTTQTKGST